MDAKNIKAIIFVIFIAALSACKKDKPLTANSAPVQDTGNIYITCEGGFGNGDAGLYIYQPLKDSIFGDVYKAVNNQALGDILESMQVIGDKFFLCVNNSNKVIVLNKKDLTLAGTVNVSQPRYILQVSNGKAYVSSLYSNKLYVLNTQALVITDSVIMPYINTEGMYLINNYAYVCTWDTACNTVFKIDISSNQIIKSIPISGYAPSEIVPDKEQKLWVLAGNQYQGKKSSLTRLDPENDHILSGYIFDSAASPMRLTFNKTYDTLYFIELNYYGGTSNNGVYRMPVGAGSLPVTPFIQAGENQYFYGLGIDPVTNYIYIADPKGFVQKGVVYIYTPDKNMINQFAVGVGPSHFYFEQ